MGYQLITILGNVGKEPELRYTANGTMRTRSWDGNDGVKHYRTELIARDVKFVGKRDAAPGGDDATPFED
jgi:single-stranded DNA-binding protein